MKELPAGFSTAEVVARQAAEGFNELDVARNRSLPKIAAEVAREPMFLLLLGAGSIYLVMGDVHEALILLGFVFVIITITVLQERRTEKALEALRDLSSPRALALRNGTFVRISGREVVRGDILALSEGDRVPADGSVLSAHELAADESLLTGESATVPKHAADPEPAGGDERGARLFAGTLVTSGQGLIRITAIGAATELGRIGRSLRTVESAASPLQHEIGTLTKRLALIGIALCLIVTLLYVYARGEWLNGLLAGIALAMGILPQEFPVILIVVLALGARRIAARRVLTRRLSAIETLGETTVLCVDKTGTLTQNRMEVAALIADEAEIDVSEASGLKELPEQFHRLLEYCVLASEIEPHDPMEQAFHRLAREFLSNTEHLHEDWDLAREYELSPTLLAMSHLWRVPDRGEQAVASKGAPEAIADLCRLSMQRKQAIVAQAAGLARRGLRVLGVARASHAGGEWPDSQRDFGFEYIGLVGLVDPLRPEVPAAMRECRQAGIRVVMITGDHPGTARAIAAQAGIDAERLLTGADLERLDDAELAEQIRGIQIFARVAPRQKLRIVEALKINGEIVAMTGDGVNDAPALKSAHIGIAMGKRGTDVAREAASLVLLDDDFGSIVEAIRLGRRIFGNLRQAMIYTLAVHIPIIGLSILPLMFGLPLVLAPIHIAFLELVIDPACSIVFEAEEADARIMCRPPRRPDERLVSLKHIELALVQGLISTVIITVVYWLTLNAGLIPSAARTLTFITLITANGMLIFSSRSAAVSLTTPLRLNNRASHWVFLGTMTALIAITRVPPLAAIFAFSATAWPHWLGAFAAGVSAFLLFEMVKWMTLRRREPGARTDLAAECHK